MSINHLLLLVGIVIIICIFTDRLTDRLGVPSLLAFIALGMCFGVDGIFGNLLFGSLLRTLIT